MARRRSGSSNNYPNASVPNTANRRLFDPNILSLIRPLRDIRLVEDRREYHPDGPFRFARALYRDSARPVASPTGASRVPVGISFKVPDHVAICVRRKQRKEVMIARGGRGSRKRKHRNIYSDMRC